jgi:hypothetical protein
MSSKKFRRAMKYIVPLAAFGAAGASRGKDRGIFNPENVKAGANMFGRSIGGIFAGLKGGFSTSIRTSNPAQAQEVKEMNAKTAPMEREPIVAAGPIPVRGESFWSGQTAGIDNKVLFGLAILYLLHKNKVI